MRKIIFFLLFFTTASIQAQELNCTVRVNAQATSTPNQQVFKTLETALNEFVNKTKWTELNFKQKEKIDCSMVINITSFSSDQFVATIQVQSSRPVYKSTYTSPVFNYNDKDFNFRYIEFENLTFNPNSFDSNLISVLAFYANVIIGFDGDTFSLKGGSDALQTAQEIVNVAQQGGYKGWSQSDGNQNRYFLVNDWLSNTFSGVREAMYDYHYKGLDTMNQDLKTSKESIKAAILSLDKLNATRPNAFVTRIFFDAKSDEIQTIFSGGPKIDMADLIDKLNRFSPSNSSKWAAIKL